MFIPSPIRQECLPEGFVATVDAYYRPLARMIAGWAADGPLVFGINGGQGTGKSTMALFLSHLLWAEHGLPAAILSIDDLYLTRAKRVELAARVHPLLATRGVPGTHDTALGIEVIDRFVAHFQRLTEHQWRVMPAVADAVLNLAADHQITSIHWREGSS